jgi:predicted secreted Zn-dependent protease
MRAGLAALLVLLVAVSAACNRGKPKYDDASTGIVIVTVEAARSADGPPLIPFAPLVNTGTVTSGPLVIGPTPRPSVTPSATRSVTATPAASPRPAATSTGPLVTQTPAATPSTAAISCAVPGAPQIPRTDVKVIEGANGVVLSQRIETRYYAVAGCTADEIAASLRRTTTQSSAGRYEVGITNSTTRYSYKYEESGGQCRLKGASISSDITVTLPDLPNTQGISPNTLARWNAFMTAIRAHEQGHVDIVLKSAGVMKATFEGTTQVLPCQQLEATLKGSVQRETDVANAANEAFDARTNHGANEGVAFP